MQMADQFDPMSLILVTCSITTILTPYCLVIEACRLIFLDCSLFTMTRQMYLKYNRNQVIKHPQAISLATVEIRIHFNL